MNAVQVAIRDHVAARYPAWADLTDPVGTRAGPRYRGLDVAILLREILRDLDLRVADNGTTRPFVIAGTGRHVRRAALADLLTSALTDVGDDALRLSVGTSAFFDALADLVPDYEGDTERGWDRRPPTSTTVSPEAVAYVDWFLREVCDEPLKVGEVFEIYLDWCAGDDVSELGRTTFYRVAEQTGLVTRRRRRDGAFFVPTARTLAQTVKRLAERTADALRSSGVEHPEDYATAVSDRLARATVNVAPDPVAEAVPFLVAAAVASADDPRRALALFGRDWLRRHPEDRLPVARLALALRDGDGVLDPLRARVALALTEEAKTNN